MQKIITLLFLCISLLIALYLEINSIIAIRPIINRYHPCLQNPANSFPCHGIYDIYAILILAIALLASLVLLLIKLIARKRKKQQTSTFFISKSSENKT